MNAQETQKQTDEYTQAATAVFTAEASPQGFEVLSALGVKLLFEFAQAENDRRETEQRWLQDLRQYRGQYDPEVLAKIGPNRSKAFVRKTRVKVKTVDSRCMDLLFPANSMRNWDVQPSPIPTITPEQKKQIIALLTQSMQPQPVEGQPPQPPVKPTKSDIDKAVKQMVKTAADEMVKTIDDQLQEAKYKEAARQVIHSGNLYGTGILKAPLVERKVRQRFIHQGGKWVMRNETFVTPFVDYVPIWRFFPDMTATDVENCRYVYERHLMTQTAMLRLAEKKSFNGQKIKDYVDSNPDGLVRPRYYDAELKAIGERQATNDNKSGQYEVLERWGWLDAKSLVSVGVKVPADRMHETFFSNVWLLPNGEVIKAVLQPINGVTWPYHLYYFDKDETSIFAEGLAAVMRDDQDMLNAGTRMILDNAAITAGPQIEVNMRLLAKNEKAEEMYPFKIWPRNGEDPTAQAIRVLEIPGHLPELQSIVAMFENNADEVTAIPRYMSGENATQGAAGTASGMSMLMGAASIVMKDLITAFDDGITKPFISALYRWNMQFNKNDKCKGDFNVVASGASSMVAKEVRAQQLDQFAALAANPMDAPYIKRDKLLRQRAEAHDLVDVVKTEEEVNEEQNNPATAQANQMAQMQQQLQMKTMEAALGKLQAEIARMSSDTERLRADALNKKMDAAYSAMQAAGIAIQSPGAAAGGDSLLAAAGWEDAPAIQPGQGQPVPQAGPDEGMHQGIETPATTDGIPA